jgi:signal transduction histidine kinase
MGWERLAHWLAALELVGLIELGRSASSARGTSSRGVELYHALLDQAERRDLHDGVLQSLTAAGLRLQSALQLIETRPDAAAQQLRSVQDIIFQEQLDLRLIVNDLKVAELGSSEDSFRLTRLLEQLQSTVEQQWGLRVTLKLDGSQGSISPATAREIYYIVREALVNAARHSGGSSATAYIRVDERQACITVSDDGSGLPLSGCPDNSASLQWTPASLKNRISILKGSLDICSTEAGTRIDIVLPLERAVA